LARALRLPGEAEIERQEFLEQEVMARRESVTAALQVLEGREGSAAGHLRDYFSHTAHQLDRSGHDELIVETELRRECIDAQRRRLLDLHREGSVSEPVLRRLERELDLSESRPTPG
jgi:hypothetical protein